MSDVYSIQIYILYNKKIHLAVSQAAVLSSTLLKTSVPMCNFPEKMKTIAYADN